MDKAKPSSPLQKRAVIDSTVLKVRRDLVNRRFYFLLWGWYVFFAFLLQFFLKAAVETRYHFLVWIGLVPVAALTVIKSKRERNETSASAIKDSMQYLWTGLGISFFVVGLIGGKGQQVCAVFILLYGLGTFVSGRILRFLPLVTGGIFCWALAVVCSFLKPNEQLLACAAAILVSYLIPAYLLKPDVQSWKTIFRTKKVWR